MESSTVGRQPTAVSRSRETRTAAPLVGVPTGLADTRAVVARDESGPRYLNESPPPGGLSHFTAGSPKSSFGIMPWNFPYYQVARFAGPNLIVGNTILLKPAPQCPESAEAMQKVYDDAGFPEGAYQTILAANDQIAEIIADPRIRGVSLTGSERAGGAVAEIAGRNLKKVVLELGGSDPFILLKTGDLDKAVQAAVDARLDNTGQSATPPSGSSWPTTCTTTSWRSSARR